MNSNDHLAEAKAVLEEARRGQLALARKSAYAKSLALLFAIWLPSMLVEAFYRLDPGGRSILLGLALTISIAGIVLIWRKLRSDATLRPGWEAERFWALRLGSLAPETLRDRLLNAIQINLPHPDSKESPSPELAANALYQAVSNLGQVSVEDALDASELKRSRKVLFIAWAAFLFTFCTHPFLFGDALGRLFRPATDFEPPPLFQLSVSPAGGWAYRGEPVEFTIAATGAIPPTVEFVYRREGGEEVVQESRLLGGKTIISSEGYPSTINYSVRSGRVSIGPYELRIVARPQVSELQYRLQPPGYTHLPVQVGRENVGDIEALPGSIAELSITASKEVSAAWVSLAHTGSDSAKSDSLPMTVHGANGKIEIAISREGRYAVRLLDRDSHPDRDPVQYRIHLMTDEPPSVHIPSPDGDVVLGDDMVVPLRIEAEDDFGISRWEIAFHRMEGDTTIGVWPLSSPRGARTIGQDTVWSLAEMALMPGDVLEYWAVAWDNNDVRGPSKSESEHRLVRLPTFEEIVNGVNQTEEQTNADAQKTLEAAKDLKEEVSKLVEDMRRDPKVDWDKQKQLQGAMDQQQKLSEQAQQLSKTLDDLVNKLEKHDLLSPETMQKYQDLQKLISEISTPELKEAMDKLKQAMDSQDPEKIRQALEQFDMDRDQFLKNIERTTNILQQLKLERKLDELVKRAEELLHAQEEALDKIKAGEKESVAKQMESQAAGTDALDKAIEEASKLSNQSQDSALAASLDSLRAEMARQQIASDMQKTGQAAAKGQSQQAESMANETARDLAGLSAALQQMSKNHKEKSKADLAIKIRRLIEELLYVSDGQEKVLKESATIGTQSPRYRDLAGTQQDMRDALAGIADRMLALSQQTFFVTPELGASLGRGLQGMDDALQDFSDRIPRSANPPQKRALGEVNHSAAQMLDILQQMQGSSSSTGYEEMMKKLAEMASAQQGLNGQSMPMPVPGQGEGGQQMDGATMSRLAAQQRALQAQMEQAAQEAGQIKDMLGDLGEVAGQMGDVAKDMEDKNITERTRHLQQQIVSRLLDATRSAKEEEYSKKRESRTGIDVSRKSPAQLQLEDEQDRLRRDLLRALQEGYTPDYRRLIQQYYDALGRAKQTK